MRQTSSEKPAVRTSQTTSWTITQTAENVLRASQNHRDVEDAFSMHKHHRMQILYPMLQKIDMTVEDFLEFFEEEMDDFLKQEEDNFFGQQLNEMGAEQFFLIPQIILDSLKPRPQEHSDDLNFKKRRERGDLMTATQSQQKNDHVAELINDWKEYHIDKKYELPDFNALAVEYFDTTIHHDLDWLRLRNNNQRSTQLKEPETMIPRIVELYWQFILGILCKCGNTKKRQFFTLIFDDAWCVGQVKKNYPRKYQRGRSSPTEFADFVGFLVNESEEMIDCRLVTCVTNVCGRYDEFKYMSVDGWGKPHTCPGYFDKTNALMRDPMCNVAFQTYFCPFDEVWKFYLLFGSARRRVLSLKYIFKFLCDEHGVGYEEFSDYLRQFFDPCLGEVMSFDVDQREMMRDMGGNGLEEWKKYLSGT